MLRVIPKHKGTEKMQADLKRRISKLLGAEKAKVVRRAPGEFIEREGAKQVLMLGGPNAGKSALMGELTGAAPEVAPYPYTTTCLSPGMMRFEDIQIQLLDSPALSREFARPWLGNQIRACDLILWTISLASDDLLSVADETIAVLREWHVELRPAGAEADAGTEPAGGSTVTKRALLVGTHDDDPAAGVRADLVTESLGPAWPLVRTSVPASTGIEELRRTIFDTLSIVRVYTKIPGKKADRVAPFVLDAGSTVMDLAKIVHHEIADHLKFARIWGQGAFDGQHVQRDHVLADGDVVELHA
jgi:ribosome-interacting GTPase 1